MGRIERAGNGLSPDAAALTRARRSDWKHLPMPGASARVAIDRRYGPGQFEALMNGFVPREMEDKWFVFYEEPWLFLHRSWTGHCIFQVRMEVDENGGARASEAIVNADPRQFASGAADAASLLASLLDSVAGRDTRRNAGP